MSAGGPEGTPANSHDISVSALYFALDNFETPAVAAEHPDWSHGQQREEAIRRIERRSADNLKKGYLPELDREAEMMTEWEVIETDAGPRMATRNGDQMVTREKLWDNFEKYARSRGEWTSELEKERKAQAEMESTVVRGEAAGAAIWLSHESGNARLLQVWEKQNDGRIVSKQYDFGHIVGRDLTKREAQRVIRDTGVLYGETRVNGSDAPHVITKEKLNIHAIAVVAKEQIIFSHNDRSLQRNETIPSPRVLHGQESSFEIKAIYSRNSGLQPEFLSIYPSNPLFRPFRAANRSKMGIQHEWTNQRRVEPDSAHEQRPNRHQLTDSVIYIGSRIAKETTETAVTLGAYVLHEVSKRENRKEETQKPTSVVERVRKLFRKSEALEMRQMQEKKPERLTIEKIRQKPVKQRAEIQKQHTEMRRVERALAFVAETKVAAGAAPFLIGTLAKEQPKAMKAVEKSVARHERKMRKVLQRERITLSEIRKKPESMRKTITIRHKEMMRATRAAKMAVEMRIAGAIPLLIATLAKEEPKAFKAVEKSIRRHRKRKWRIASGAVPAGRQEWRIRSRETLKKEKRHVKSIEKKRKSKARKDRVIGVEKRNKKEKRPNHGRNETLRTVRAERKHLRKVIEKKLLVGEKRPKRERGLKVTKEQQREKKILKMLEQKGVKGKEKMFRITLVQLTRRLRTIQTETKRAKKSSRAVERQERPREAGFFPRGKKESFVQYPIEPVRTAQKVATQFAYAWVLWTLLNLPERSQIREVGEVRSREAGSRFAGEKKGAPPNTVPTPWILLSIIWYLTAIREQGMAVANSSSLTPIQSGLIVQRRKNHTKSNYRSQSGKRATRFQYPAINSLSRYGVIYYYQAPFKNLTPL